jgi:antitoxin CptB
MSVQASPKIYWRCRRGMAELDILFQDYLNKDYQQLSTKERADFEQLLTCNDNDLLEYLMGRTTPSESNLINVVTKIRQSVSS